MDVNEPSTLDKDSTSLVNNDTDEEDRLDRLRRGEEISNLLSNVMDEYNFDQSTTNASLVSNDDQSIIVPAEIPSAMTEHYREASGEDQQLMVLYQVRVREVEALSEQLRQVNSDHRDLEEILKQKTIFFNRQLEQKTISLKEAQDLLVEKAEKINALDKELENMKSTLQKFEAINLEHEQEILLLRESNAGLEQQALLMERGFPLQSNTGNREYQEAQKNEIFRLENALKTALELGETKDKQYKGLAIEFTQHIEEQAKCLETKDGLIHKLTEELANEQFKCQELLNTVKNLSEAQKATVAKETHLEEELRKMREADEKSRKTDSLCESVQRVMAQEWHVEISSLKDENKQLQDILHTQDREFKKIQEQLHTMRSTESEKDNLHKELEELQASIREMTANRDLIVQKLSKYKSTQESLKAINKELTEEIESLGILKGENSTLRATIIGLESVLAEMKKPLSEEESSEAIRENLESLEEKQKLEEQVKHLLQENLRLGIDVQLSKERDSIIEDLQKKADIFEKIIHERREELTQPTTISIGINTDPQEDSLLKIKYDTIVYKTEVRLRQELAQELNERMDKFIADSTKRMASKICTNCITLTNAVTKLEQEKILDHAAVGKLVDSYTAKFNAVEAEFERSNIKLKAFYERKLAATVQQLEEDYNAHSMQMVEHLQKATGNLEQQKDKLLQSGQQHYTLVKDKIDSIIAKIRDGRKEVRALKKHYQKEVASLSQQQP